MPQQPSLTIQDVARLVAMVLAHGWGELRVIIYDHRIDQVTSSLSVKHPEELSGVSLSLTSSEEYASVRAK